MAGKEPDGGRSPWRGWLSSLESPTIVVAGLAALTVSVLDLFGFLDGVVWLHSRIPVLTLLLLGILGVQQALERFGSLGTLRDQLSQSRQQLSAISTQVQEVDRNLTRVRESLVLQPVDGRFDRALRDVSAALQAAQQIPHPVFYSMISRHLEQFRMLVKEWHNGTFRTQGEEYHQLLYDLYLHSKASVFSTSAPSYLPTWQTTLGSKLLAAHERNTAEVTRVFLFDRRADVTASAIAEMRRQSKVKNVEVRVYIKDEDHFFRLPADMSDDFTVIDDGEVIGTTVAFGGDDESRLTASWFFCNAPKKHQFAYIVSALKSNSVTFEEFEGSPESAG